MQASFTRPFITLLGCALGLLLLVSRAPAQSSGTDPYKGVITTSPSPYWGYTYSPYGDAVRAEGDFLIKKQEAALLREQVRQKKLETRRLELEHWEWERDFRLHALNREQKSLREAQVEYNRNFPPLTQILAAGSLNSLLDELVKRPELPAAGSTPLDADGLAHVHVTVDGRGNIGLLKDDKISWPQILLRSDFADDRERMAQLLARAKEQVLVSQSKPEVLHDLRAVVKVCDTRLGEEIRNGTSDAGWNTRHYIEGLRFLKQVGDAIFLLEKPDAAFYLKPLEGKTVAELVAYMKKEGVRFAPATEGCERYYVALHRALADEVTRLQNQEPAAKKP